MCGSGSHEFFVFERDDVVRHNLIVHQARFNVTLDGSGHPPLDGTILTWLSPAILAVSCCCTSIEDKLCLVCQMSACTPMNVHLQCTTSQPCVGCADGSCLRLLVQVLPLIIAPVGRIGYEGKDWCWGPSTRCRTDL